MIGLTITDTTGNVSTYNPHIQTNLQPFDLNGFKLAIELSALSIANQINTHVAGLDLANVATIVLALNNNTVTYITPTQGE